MLNFANSPVFAILRSLILMDKVNWKRWLQFLIFGGLNTALTYGVYLLLNSVISYQAAYIAAYITGVVFSYLYNSLIVFKVAVSWRGIMMYPMVYFIQYIAAALILGFLVEGSYFSEKLAPLIVAIVMIPITYLLSKFMLEYARGTKGNSSK